MWGEPVPLASLNLPPEKRRQYSDSDVVVDAPIGKTLFDACEWKSFMSSRWFFKTIVLRAKCKVVQNLVVWVYMKDLNGEIYSCSWDTWSILVH